MSSQPTMEPLSGRISFGFVRGIIATARYMKYRSATSRTIGSQTIRKPRMPLRISRDGDELWHATTVPPTGEGRESPFRVDPARTCRYRTRSSRSFGA